MPCNSDGYDDTYDKLQEATRAACEMAKALTSKQKEKLSPTCKMWIARHEEIDRQRIAEERRRKADKEVRKKALQKLSKAERELLGVGE